jgi:lipoate-protein ligase A
VTGWDVIRRHGSAAEHHAADVHASDRRALWFAVDRPALVLGSTQRPAVVDAERAAADGVEVVRRRSGGGAVLLVPDEHVWLDVVIGRHDPLWTDDVSASARWLGRVWADALGELGLGEPVVHHGPMRRDRLAELVCFAGLAPGEVTTGGAKVVGISQRRTSEGARFQCVALRRWDPVAYAALLDDGAGDLADELAAVPVAVVDRSPEVVVAAVAAALPD